MKRNKIHHKGRDNGKCGFSLYMVTTLKTVIKLVHNFK